MRFRQWHADRKIISNEQLVVSKPVSEEKDLTFI